METAKSFGRRPQRQEQRPRPKLVVQSAAPEVAPPVVKAPPAPQAARAEAIVPSDVGALAPSVEDEIAEEIEAYKRARGIRVPWRQLSLIASLSFGIAWFVLPDSVNNVVDYLLLGMAAAGFVGGVIPRKKSEADTSSPAP